ncbi:MAG: Smr/MutS family protein [Giesbergeria sp.]|nr:Smr/MutS family protein [Giesbergeria sp.]MBP6321766.1 Smr/MutS family protein [Giesbergeria sp.]
MTLSSLSGALAAALLRANAAPTTEVAPEPPATATPRQQRRAAAAARYAHQQARRQLGQRPAPAPSAPSAAAKPRRSAPAARRASLRLNDLQDLSSVAQHLREQQERAEALAKAQREAAAKRQAERQLFSLSVGAITPLRSRNLIDTAPEPIPPLPMQHWLDEERVLRESISDDFDVSTLLDTDDQLSFRRPGIGVEITRRLRSGHWSIQRQLDLHGLRTDEAREALGQFIRHAHKTGLRCVRVVHGKGLGSPGKTPVLKGRVQRWLVQKKEVLAFVQARPMDGGAGALLVLLQPVGQQRPRDERR